MSAATDVAAAGEWFFSPIREIQVILRRHGARNFIRFSGFIVALLLAGTAAAGDAFDDARYAIGIKENATALRLIDSGQFDINMQNGEGYTLLSFAAGDGNLAMVDALLARGADPAIKNSLGQTALDRAVGTMVTARLKASGAKSGLATNVAKPATAGPARKAEPVKRDSNPAQQSPNAKMCASRHYSSSALCSDSTCKMREYRKWQTCLKTGSYY